MIEVGVNGNPDLPVEGEHLRLALGDRGLELLADLLGKVSEDLVHQLAHDVAYLVRGIDLSLLIIRDVHAGEVVVINLHRRLGSEVYDDQSEKAPSKRTKQPISGRRQVLLIFCAIGE